MFFSFSGQLHVQSLCLALLPLSKGRNEAINQNSDDSSFRFTREVHWTSVITIITVITIILQYLQTQQRVDNTNKEKVIRCSFASAGYVIFQTATKMFAVDNESSLHLFSQEVIYQSLVANSSLNRMYLMIPLKIIPFTNNSPAK